MSETSDKNAQLSPVKRAIVELRRARGRIEALERAKSEPIAIIGAGLRFPGGANDLENFWRLLRDGIDTVTEVPADRWDIEAFYDPDPDAPGKMSTRWGSFLDDVDKFDADFFGISPREAVTMDPQQRLLMTVAWEALENAGQSPQRLMGSSTGVFVGIAGTDYLQMQLQRSSYEEIDAYLASGSCHSVAAGRLSYFLGLQGPSIAVDTACSSSLVAVHLACQSLRSGECNLALAGGVNLILSPEMVINFSKARMMAADGRCKVFDAAADGYVRGEGGGIVVLKRLSDAEKDGDRILAVIRGSAVNQDGRSNGLTAPNGPAQQAVIRQALSNAEVKPAEVDFVETHGTGTALGDPIEVQALAAALGEGRGQDRPLTIASIKTNIGHLESAAGVAGLMKVVAGVGSTRRYRRICTSKNPILISLGGICRSVFPRRHRRGPRERGGASPASVRSGFPARTHTLLSKRRRKKISPTQREKKTFRSGRPICCRSRPKLLRRSQNWRAVTRNIWRIIPIWRSRTFATRRAPGARTSSIVWRSPPRAVNSCGKNSRLLLLENRGRIFRAPLPTAGSAPAWYFSSPAMTVTA